MLTGFYDKIKSTRVNEISEMQQEAVQRLKGVGLSMEWIQEVFGGAGWVLKVVDQCRSYGRFALWPGTTVDIYMEDYATVESVRDWFRKRADWRQGWVGEQVGPRIRGMVFESCWGLRRSEVGIYWYVARWGSIVGSLGSGLYMSHSGSWWISDRIDRGEVTEGEKLIEYVERVDRIDQKDEVWDSVGLVEFNGFFFV